MTVTALRCRGASSQPPWQPLSSVRNWHVPYGLLLSLYSSTMQAARTFRRRNGRTGAYSCLRSLQGSQQPAHPEFQTLNAVDGKVWRRPDILGYLGLGGRRLAGDLEGGLRHRP
eukprot:1808397-Prymnesium_polylepis.1